jgi:Cellulase (glycosyl hydrolase family 5)
MSDAFADHPGVLAYGLMNEPHDLEIRETATPHVWHTFDDGTQGWTGPVAHEQARVRTGDGALRVSWPAGAESLFVSNNDEGRKDCATNGSTLSAWLYLPPDAPAGLWTASLQVQGTTYEYQAGPHEPLRPGRWTNLRVTPPPSLLGACRAFALYFTGPPGEAVELYADDVTQEGRLLPAQVWEAASQAVVTALRERDDDTLLMISGHGWSSVQTWTAQHPEAWIEDPRQNIRYEAHHYWDQARRSDYRSYADELAYAEMAE